ncbi:50S ribosomal protein [Dirofilaria immitis]
MCELEKWYARNFILLRCQLMHISSFKGHLQNHNCHQNDFDVHYVVFLMTILFYIAEIGKDKMHNKGVNLTP